MGIKKKKKKEIHVKAQLHVYRDPVAVAMPCASALISRGTHVTCAEAAAPVSELGSYQLIVLQN